MTIKNIILGGLAALVMGSCATEVGSPAYCSKDTECKGERVCVKGICEEQGKYGGEVKGSSVGRNISCEIKKGPNCEDFTGCYYPDQDSINLGANFPICFQNRDNCVISTYIIKEGKSLCDLNCSFEIIINGNYFIDYPLGKDKKGSRYVHCGTTIFLQDFFPSDAEDQPINLGMLHTTYKKDISKKVDSNLCCEK